MIHDEDSDQLLKRALAVAMQQRLLRWRMRDAASTVPHSNGERQVDTDHIIIRTKLMFAAQ
jgi:hypothetical protein